MICSKKLFLFDEPTSGLDYQSMKQVAELIQYVAKDSIVFVVSHDTEFTNLVCNKIYELEKEFDYERKE